MIEALRYHSGKLTGTWFVGVITWVTEATNFIGLLGAVVGCIAGVMLIAIRWEEFTQSRLYRWAKAKLSFRRR